MEAVNNEEESAQRNLESRNEHPPVLADLEAGGEEASREARIRAFEALREQVAADALKARAEAEARFLERRETCCDPKELLSDPPIHPEDEDVLPDSSVAAIASALPEALERERRFDARWFRLLPGLFWRSKPPWFFNDERITPASFQSSYDIDKSVSEFIGQRPWPNGVSPEAGVFPLCWAYFRNVWQMKKQAGWKSFIFSCLAEIVPPIVSWIFGTCLVDELSAATSIGQSKEKRFRNASLYAVLILVLRALQLWFKWVWEFEIPGMAFRYYTRGNLYHVLRNLNGPIAQRFESPASVAAFMTLDVQQAVENVWEATLLLPSYILGFLVTLGIALSTIVGGSFGARALSIVVIMLLLASTTVIAPALYFFYKPKWLHITKLYYEWNFRMFSMYAAATPNPYSEKKNKPDVLYDIFGETIFIYVWRGFHNFFVGLGMQFAINLLLYIIITGVYIFGIREHLERNMTVGEFLTLTGACWNMVSLASQLGVYFNGLHNGYVAVTRMAEVINSCEDDDARVLHTAIHTDNKNMEECSNRKEE